MIDNNEAARYIIVVTKSSNHRFYTQIGAERDNLGVTVVCQRMNIFAGDAAIDLRPGRK
jgi:hypothetical protein